MTSRLKKSRWSVQSVDASMKTGIGPRSTSTSTLLMTSILKVAQPQSAPTVSTKLTSTYSWLKTLFLC